ncbi:UNVERIFIED_CONTAM: hypothetical protein GTU68_023462 [Idotea baltica]|nr:hypothetical protein [Idotea baltica]
MHKRFFKLSLSLIIAFGAVIAADAQQSDSPIEYKTAIFAGGCFWCIEADFEKLDGVSSVVSGYTGGSAETANYKTVTYENTGHFEAVEVSYDPSKVSYAKLVDYFWHHIDPTDSLGQFCDKGDSYKSAVFYASEEEKTIIEQSIAELNNTKSFNQDIVTTVAAAKPFYLAEDYHQDYYKKNPIRYNFYRKGCGRDARIEELWGQ